MNITDSLNKMLELLPVVRPDKLTFRECLQQTLQKYVEILKETDDTELKLLFENGGQKGMTKRRLLNFIDRINSTILRIVEAYLSGESGDAYRLLENLFKNSRVDGKHGKAIHLTNYLNDTYGNYFSLSFKQKENKLHRVRYVYNKGDIKDSTCMFHIPFEHPEWVSTQRFSIPGFPCLYLGTDKETCMKELGEFKGKYAFHQSINCNGLVGFMSFRIPEINNIDESDAAALFMTFPFYIAVLMQTKYPDKPFKPEYIIPQLILQYVKSEGYQIGVIYPSTKFVPCDSHHENVVAFPEKHVDSGHCEKLLNIFSFDNLPVDITQEVKDFFECNK